MNVLELKNLKHSELIELFNDDSKIIELLKDNVSLHRYNHSLSVASCAKILAKYHGIDQNKAYKAGLLHDLCKDVPIDIQKEILMKNDPIKADYPVGTLHGYTCYYLLKELDVIDDEILSSIYNHSILEHKSILNIIIFISDKREPLRNIDDDIFELAKEDLISAYHKLIDDVKEYLVSKNEQPIKSCY